MQEQKNSAESLEVIDENPAPSVDLTPEVEAPVPNEVEADLEAQDAEIVSKEDVMATEGEVIEIVDPPKMWTPGDADPEASDAPESPEPAESGTEDTGTDEPPEMLPEPEVTEAAESYLDRIRSKIAGDPKTEKAEDVEPPEEEKPDEDEAVAEAPKRNVNPRNTRA